MRWKRRDGVMNAAARRVQRVYFVLLLLHTLAASFNLRINTLFDAARRAAAENEHGNGKRQCKNPRRGRY